MLNSYVIAKSMGMNKTTPGGNVLKVTAGELVAASGLILYDSHRAMAEISSDAFV